MSELSSLSVRSIADALEHQLKMRSLVRFEPLNRTAISQVTALKASCHSTKVAAVAILLRLPN
ncbi:MAG: hypothetical protein ACPL6F_04570, partial [Anaerolineales bacterium]